MKLAEALQLRADLNKQIDMLQRRISNNIVVQEGDNPAEEPTELINQLNECLKQQEELIGKINLTNCSTFVNDKTLTELIAQKDILMLKINAYRDIVSKASNIASRMTRTEIRYMSTVNAREIQKEVDTMSATLRKLENIIQQTNWTTEL